MKWFRRGRITPEQREFNEVFVSFMEGSVKAAKEQGRINDAVITCLEAQGPFNEQTMSNAKAHDLWIRAIRKELRRSQNDQL